MTRAMHEIQSDAMRLIEVRLKGAIESCNWAAVNNYASQLADIAQRGLYHQSQEHMKDITAHAMRNYEGEREAR